MDTNIKYITFYYSEFGNNNIIYPSEIAVNTVINLDHLHRLYYLKDFTNQNLVAYLYKNTIIWIKNDE